MRRVLKLYCGCINTFFMSIKKPVMHWSDRSKVNLNPCQSVNPCIFYNGGLTCPNSTNDQSNFKKLLLEQCCPHVNKPKIFLWYTKTVEIYLAYAKNLCALFRINHKFTKILLVHFCQSTKEKNAVLLAKHKIFRSKIVGTALANQSKGWIAFDKV